MRITINVIFTDTGALKSAPLSNFPFKTKCVICKDRYLHIPKPKLEVSENKKPIVGEDTPTIRYANKGKDNVH